MQASPFAERFTHREFDRGDVFFNGLVSWKTTPSKLGEAHSLRRGGQKDGFDEQAGAACRAVCASCFLWHR